MPEARMHTVELSAGVIEYDDTGGTGPVVVFLHGLTMDGTVWDRVVSRLPDDVIRRDLKKYGLSIPDDATLLQWTEACSTFDRPVLVVWGHDDKIMPIEHGRRLSRLFPNAALVELHDTYTLVPIDQPERLASEIEAFVPRDA